MQTTTTGLRGHAYWMPLASTIGLLLFEVMRFANPCR
jgi:hypothetical protein